MQEQPVAQVRVPAAPGAAGPGPLPALQPEAGAQPECVGQVRGDAEFMLSHSAGLGFRCASEPLHRIDERPRASSSRPRLHRQSRALLVRPRTNRYVNSSREVMVVHFNFVLVFDLNF